MTPEINYISTRGGPTHRDSTRGPQESASFTRAIRTPTALDGGLLVATELPRFSRDDLIRLEGKRYPEFAAEIIKRFRPNLSPEDVAEDTEGAYGERFADPNVVPLVPLKGKRQHIQELFGGPTNSFKDFGLGYLAKVASRVVERNNETRRAEGRPEHNRIVVNATSGDTGGATLEAFADLPGFYAMTFFPNIGVSEIQRRQMAGARGNNVAAYSIDGNFDQAQKGVKDAFSDPELRTWLEKAHDLRPFSSNSINWGRIVPQIAYHFRGYVDLVEQEVIKPGDKIDIAVPSGNFGNILAAYYAKEMGLPVEKLICASNENNVLTDFLQTGRYDIRRRTLTQTPSPSMDILVASNIERLLYAITHDQDPATASIKVKTWMDELSQNGIFEVDKATKQRLKEDFVAGSVSNEDSLTNIRRVYDETGYVMDPHTSVAQKVAEDYQKADGNTRQVVVCATADPAKFPIDVLTAITGEKNDDAFEALATLDQLEGFSTPASIASLRQRPLRTREIIPATPEAVKDAVRDFLENHAA